MKTGYLLGIALGVATLVAACGDAPSGELGGGGTDRGNNNGSSTVPGDDGTDPGTDPGNTGGSSTPAPTNSPDGKAYFLKEVHPSLSKTCAGCHSGAGPGPEWLYAADGEKSYTMMFQRSYVVQNSILLTKGPHSSGAPALTSEQSTKVTTWIQMELKDGGAKAPPNVLEKIGDCFDRAKFDAIGLQNIRTIQRTNNNNTNNITPWNENANNCTGCNQAPCRSCHSAGDAGFVVAIGINTLPQSYTFDESKKTPFISKYFGVSPTGEPIGSNGLRLKAEATQKDKAYSHPMYRVDDNLQARIDAFVNDAVTKYKAGTCGK